VTWTAEANGFSDTPTGLGGRKVRSHHVVMAGSTVVRKLDKLPGGTEDDFPFNLIVADDYDEVETEPTCYGGISRRHEYWSIRDPGRYNFGPEGAEGDLYVEPYPNPDGTWFIFDPFVTFGATTTPSTTTIIS